MARSILWGSVLVLGLVVVLSPFTVAQVQAGVIDFESAAGNDNDDFVATNPMFGGLDWSQNGDIPNPDPTVSLSRWQIDTDNNPFASLPAACLDDASKWVQGFAEGVSTPGGGAGDPNRAKFGWDGINPFEFNSLWLRTRFVEDAENAVDNNGDGIDDRWLTSIELVFRDTNNNESSITIDLTLPGDPSGWIEVTAADVTGSADLSQLKAVFFYGDSGTTVSTVRNDRFAVDNLDVVTSQNGSPPIAKCQDVTVSADENCQGYVDPEDVDNGSCDPDGGFISFSLEPSSPYGLGDATVTLTVTDDNGDSDSCDATVTVINETPLEVICNAPKTIVPRDAPISFTATVVDSCGEAAVEVSDYDCDKCTRKGKRNRKTGSCVINIAGDTITILDSGGVGNHINWTVIASDDSGNTAEAFCKVLVVKPGKHKKHKKKNKKK